jgi:putative PEP-CTERM system TPR-repeat lipoprotein
MNKSTIQRALARSTPVTLGALLTALLVACSGGGGTGAEQIASAKSLLEKKDAKAAVIELKNALQKNPKSPEARYLLGKTLLEGGDPVTALVELQKAQELQVADELVIPEIARALLMVGDEAKLLTQYGGLTLKDDAAGADLKTSLATASAVKADMPGAKRQIEEALRLKPGYAPAMILQARVSASEGDFDGALALLNKSIAADAFNERAGLLKGEYLLQAKHDPEAALAAYRQVLTGRAGSVAARSAVANILFQQRKLPEARVEFDLLKKTAPEHPETLLLQAQFAFMDGDLKATKDLTERLLKAAPNNVRTLELAGAAALRGKNYLQAEAHLSQAMKLAPTLLRPRVLLAQTYLRSGQAEKCLEVLQPVLEAKGADATSLSLAGEAYLQTGDNKRSEEAFNRALKAAPANTTVRASAAIAQLARGDTSGTALAELEAVAAGDAGPRADLALISARLRQNDLAGALKAIDAVEKKLPDQPLAHLLRGRVLLLKKDAAGARRSFETALSKDPAYFPAVASLAAIDLADGKPDAARARFEAHLKAQPKAYQAKLALAELEVRTGAPAATVVATLKDATRINPVEPMPHLMLIGRLIGSGDGKAALAAAQDASAALPDNLEIQDALGMAQVAAGDSQRAVSTFKKLNSLQPKNATVLLHLADAYRASQDPAAAMGALKQALELQPDLQAARGALIGMNLQARKPDEAMALARDQQKRNPKDAAGFRLEGEVAAAGKNWDAATTAFRAALQRERDGATAVKLHAVLSAAGKTAEADKLSADWVKDNPQDTVFRFYEGDVAMARNDFATAEARYRTVLELQPNNALALNNVAWMLARQGKTGGVALAEKANSLVPDRAPLLDTLSLALEVDKQLPRAIEAQARAVKLEPTDHSMALRLAKLYIKSGDKTRAKAELEALAKVGDKFAGQAEVASLMKSL